MFIDCFDNNGGKYLRLVRSVRTEKDDGRKTTSKIPVFNIGPLAKFDDGEPNYLERLRQSFRNGHPLIPALLPYVKAIVPQKYSVEFVAGSKYCAASPKRFAPCILDPVFSALGIDALMATIKHSSKIQYDLQGIVRLLTYGRLLDPDSKIATMRQNDSYYAPLVKSSNDDNVYDALDVIYKNRKQIIQRMNSCITKGIGRNTNTVYYDVTNFFFEIEEPDEDEVDDEGNVIEKGLRKMGVCKEERKLPIVQMGLFLDDNGIPISIEQFSGNTLDHLTLRAAMKNTVNDLKLNRFILIADRGMYSGTNMCHVVNQGHGYIVSKSLKKSAQTERKWVLNQDGYTVISPDFKYKSQIVTRTVTNEDGAKRKIQEKVVAAYVDTQLDVLGAQIVGIGSVHDCVIDKPGIFRSALLIGASGIVLMHNHPAGLMYASDEDVACTKEMIRIGKLIGIPMIDHIIFADEGYHSMRASGEAKF